MDLPGQGAAQVGELINSGKSLAVDCEDWDDVIFSGAGWNIISALVVLMTRPKAPQAAHNRSRHRFISGFVVVLMSLSSVMTS